MLFSRFVKYIKYLFIARHRKGRGIHSPFVFDLTSRIMWNKNDPGIVSSIERVRKKMISDPRTILVSDFGSRSELFNSNFRRVADIARYSPVPKKYGQLLANMAAEFGKPFIIELGTSLGISTMYLASGNRDTTVRTIEGCHSTAEIARQNFKEAGFSNIDVTIGAFDDVLPVFETIGIKPGLVFIDGNHRKEAVIKYFNRIVEFSDIKTVIIIDDINYSNEMTEAWNEIKLHEKVSVSIDIFRMGILFFREGINHNDFIVRY